MNFDSMKGKKVLVAGGTGLLGTSLTKRLIDLGLSVTSTYFSRPPAKSLKANFQRYDFTQDKDCLEATQGQNYVIICAVQASGVANVGQSPTAAILPNLEIPARLLEACCENNVKKAVWISSSTVYQEAFYPIREDQLDLNQPTDVHYQSLGGVYRYLEALARCYYDKRGLQIGVIRTTNIYGPYDRFDEQKSHVIPALIMRALRKETPFVVWGNGHTVRDFVYVDDLTEGVLRVLNSYCNGDPINISNGTPTSIRELIEVILDVCNHSTIPNYDIHKPTAIPYRVLDNTKFNTLLGKIEKTPLIEGIRKTVEWYNSYTNSEL
jgi:GDP-L-fucose synthase